MKIYIVRDRGKVTPPSKDVDAKAAKYSAMIGFIPKKEVK